MSEGGTPTPRLTQAVCPYMLGHHSCMPELWVGRISQVYEVAYDGIVVQALLATMAIVLISRYPFAPKCPDSRSTRGSSERPSNP